MYFFFFFYGKGLEFHSFGLVNIGIKWVYNNGLDQNIEKQHVTKNYSYNVCMCTYKPL